VTKGVLVKHYVSRTLKLIAAIYMAFPISYIVFAALLFDIPGKNCSAILLRPSYYALSMIGAAAGFGIWEMRRWGWYVFLFTNALIAYTNAVLVVDFSQSSHKIAAYFATLLGLALLTYRVSKEVRVPYFLPRIRWWESDPRYRLCVAVSIQRTSGETNVGDILDLSLGGCFIKFRTDLHQDETIALQFTVFGQALSCAGTVVWRTQTAVTHPKGIGVKFAPMPRAQKRALKLINQRLRQISTLYNTSRYLMSQDEFLKKMEALQRKDIFKTKSA
jgi:hypothetical protein